MFFHPDQSRKVLPKIPLLTRIWCYLTSSRSGCLKHSGNGYSFLIPTAASEPVGPQPWAIESGVVANVCRQLIYSELSLDFSCSIGTIRSLWCAIKCLQVVSMLILHRVPKKCHYIFADNFAECWSIFKILSHTVLAVTVY